jgi:glucose-6-phosphate-specific signal transduction histidine kinase
MARSESVSMHPMHHEPTRTARRIAARLDRRRCLHWRSGRTWFGFVATLISLFMGVMLIRRLIAHWHRRTDRLRHALLAQGEALGRQALMEEVRMLTHAQLKAHAMATQRCLLQARDADDARACATWLATGLEQCEQLVQVVVGLHQRVGDSALPDDLEQTVRETVAGLSLAYPDCACRVEVFGRRTRTIGPEIQRALVLVLYNALHNAYTHARPSSVQVQLQYAPDAIVLLVGDNGTGTTPHSGPHFGRGLSDMQHLIACFGGRLRIEQQPGTGTLVSATVPLAREEIDDASA